MGNKKVRRNRRDTEHVRPVVWGDGGLTPFYYPIRPQRLSACTKINPAKEIKHFFLPDLHLEILQFKKHSSPLLARGSNPAFTIQRVLPAAASISGWNPTDRWHAVATARQRDFLAGHRSRRSGSNARAPYARSTSPRSS